LDLRHFVAWCEGHGLKLFAVRRADIELYARALEEAGRARATVARRLCTVAGFYRYAEEEGLVATSPAVHVRRPRLDYDSHAVGLDQERPDAKTSARNAMRQLRTSRTASGGTLLLREFIAKPVIYVLAEVTLGIVYFWLLWDKNNQELWDKMVGTIVVNDPQEVLIPAASVRVELPPPG